MEYNALEIKFKERSLERQMSYRKRRGREIELYLQKDVFIRNIGINKMYICSITWVFQYGSSNLEKKKKKQKVKLKLIWYIS